MKTWLKAQLHTHIRGDPDDYYIKYTIIDLIDIASKKGFDVLSVTCHNKIVKYSKKVEDYAKKKNIFLIKGVELRIENKDILVYNPPKDILKVKKIEELYFYKKNYDILIGAPHPFYKPNSLGKKVIEHNELFDFFEYCFFYSGIFNVFNNEIVSLAKKINKPIIGTSDVHHLKFINQTYSLIHADKNQKSIFESIKKGDVKLVTKPLSIFTFFFESFKNLKEYLILYFKISM